MENLNRQRKTEELSEFSPDYHLASKLWSRTVLFHPDSHPSPQYYFEANPSLLKDEHIAIIIPNKAISNNSLLRIYYF